jgi:hypothetical protein
LASSCSSTTSASNQSLPQRTRPRAVVAQCPRPAFLRDERGGTDTRARTSHVSTRAQTF